MAVTLLNTQCSCFAVSHPIVLRRRMDNMHEQHVSLVSQIFHIRRNSSVTSPSIKTAAGIMLMENPLWSFPSVTLQSLNILAKRNEINFQFSRAKQTMTDEHRLKAAPVANGFFNSLEGKSFCWTRLSRVKKEHCRML